MAEPADPLDINQVTWQPTGVAERVECRNTGAHERRSFGGIERCWHPG
jgi:hypothetical protein